MVINNLIILTVFFNLFSYLLLTILGNNLGKKGSTALSFLFSLLSIIFALLSLYFNYFVGTSKSIQLSFGCWLDSGIVLSELSFTFDSLSLAMELVVLGVSILVILFSFNYMENDPDYIKFLSYLALFTFFMTVLITSDNLFLLFMGWEGVGLCSYLLVGFWYSRVQAGKSSLKALLMNRVGDFFFILGMALSFKFFKTLDITTILALAPYFSDFTVNFNGLKITLIDVTCLMLIVGAFGKSAQIGLHTWLPDAMEGPTPVSALIHAATMVTAGVFLVVRMSYLFDYSYLSKIVLILFGTFTSIFAGLTALSQWDMKKVIAFSTCSQLGYMFVSCGVSSYIVSFYHLYTHAFFKAALFLIAGYVIHLFFGEQDIRKMGSLINLSPFIFVSFLIASFSLMGLTFYSGYFSKEAIAHLFAFCSYSAPVFWAVFLFFLFSLFLTIYYSIRLIYYVGLFINSNLFKKAFSGLWSVYLKNRLNKYMYYSILILVILSVFSGYFFKEIFLPGGLFFNFSIPVSKSDFSVYSEFVFTDLDIVLLFLIILVFFLAKMAGVFKYPNFIISSNNKESFSFVYSKSTKAALMYFINPAESKIFGFFNNKFYFDIIYNYLALKLLNFSYGIMESLEKGSLEILGPSGVSTQTYLISINFTKLQTGVVNHYLSVIFLTGLILIVLVLL